MQDISTKFDIAEKFKAKNYDLAHFNKIVKQVSKTQERPYPRWGDIGGLPRIQAHGYKYTIEDVTNALDNLSLVEMRRISRYFYNTSTSYRRQIDHFAQLYKYYYVVDFKRAAQTKKKNTLLKIYNETLDFLDSINIRDIFGYITQKVLVDGAFFGYVNEFDDNKITITQLNPNYCRSRDTSAYGTACVEFNVQYFARYQDKADLEKTLKNFPAGVRSYWNAYHAGKVISPWVRLATESSCAFFMDNKCTPPIYSSIIDIMNFGDYKNIEKKRDSSELEKLLVQQFKLDEDGDLDVLMEEMAGMHEAVSQMMNSYDNIDVLTTIADNVDLKDTQSNTNRSGETNLQKMLLPKYENAGLSSEIFYATGGTTLEYSVNNATSFMSQLIDKYSTWLSMLCYSQFNYGKIIPIVTILPITWYNQSKMADMYIKNSQYGFSWILPYVASGKKQSTLLDNAYIEQEVLNLSEVMRPLSSSFTQTDEGNSNGNKTSTQKKPAGTPGRPEKPMEEKSDKTIANINAQQ